MKVKLLPHQHKAIYSPYKYTLLLDGSRFTVYFHKEIMGNPSDVVDHINRDKRDNRKTNLRVCSTSQNSANAKRWTGKKTFKGSHFEKSRGLYASSITVQGKRVFLGRYKTDEEAHIVYCFAALFYFKEFAWAE